MPTVDEVISKYVELRDRKAVLAKKQSEEMAPLNQAMETIENFLMHQMNTLGVDQLKAREHGTAFKAHSTSCQMADPLAFKSFVFQPVADGVINYLKSTGYGIRDMDIEAIANIIRDLPKWDMIDFRVGKKGVQEYIANENQPVPGVAVNTVATINIRRA